MMDPKDYCKRLGLDPFEMVWGYLVGHDHRCRVFKERWRWYIGAR